MNHPFLVYLFAINILAGAIFAFDKSCARHQRRRIPERTLHLFELAGGFPMVLLLMYLIHHKNAKSSYYLYTYLITLLWIAAIALWFYLLHKGIVG